MAILLVSILKTHRFNLAHESCTTNPVKGEENPSPNQVISNIQVCGHRNQAKA